jgi:hypothetical protein
MVCKQKVKVENPKTKYPMKPWAKKYGSKGKMHENVR